MRKRRLLLLPLLLAVFLLGLLRDIALNDDALRVHVVCPEHGEILHASASKGTHAELRALDPAAALHQGCHLDEFSALPGIVPVALPMVAPAQEWSILATLAAPRGPPPAGLSPLLLAPKTSPPTA